MAKSRLVYFPNAFARWGAQQKHNFSQQSAAQEAQRLQGERQIRTLEQRILELEVEMDKLKGAEN